MLNISDEAFQFLVIQRARYYGLHHDRGRWHGEYMESLERDFAEITQHARGITSVLDIGSGLGGIDILLRKRLGVRVALLDGDGCRAVVIKQDKPFSNRDAALRFMSDNAVDDCIYIDADHPAPYACDLVVSFGSWCFHYPPSEYLDYVARQCQQGAYLMIDMRLEKPEWIDDLKVVFDHVATIRQEKKLQRMVFVRNGEEFV